ncbi:multidrug efflux MFS transporter [Clostridium sardiniense]|uniref:Multidrug efflux MFS transporter n=1 Tax=Clostridium sardiniense TaxID=29369 RepID=A0ABS7L1G2_CLOSR|nr:multidrug efflux MFS transporter [Clostridium sardiniense]MBY0756905.1 multidrug efflux MFS transporter [Clostridium sardiniense]MDQ0458750.1 MFS family permease [Clostridium sardiniense]
MENWKRNLIICWFGTFITMVGMSQIAPILPIYIKQLGISDVTMIEQLSGIAFGVTFVVSGIFSPIWGKLADKYGRKPMLLRASLGMAIVVLLMGFVHNVYVLIGLRLLQGTISGYSTACTTLIATQTDREHAGTALGTLSTAGVAGSLLGPMIGGYLEGVTGIRSVFFITGVLLLIVFISTILFVKEDFQVSKEKALKFKEVWDIIPNKNLMIAMFVTSFVLQLAFYSIEPIITVYVTDLSKNATNIAFISGMVFSTSGLANILAARRLGRLSDRIGAHKVMLVALIFAGIIFIPQAFVKNPWQLMGLRFFLGLSAAGLNPSINAIIKKITPDKIVGRAFGFNMSAQYFGTFGGSILGGQVAAFFGIKYIFFITSTLLLLNGLWVYKLVYKKIEE